MSSKGGLIKLRKEPKNRRVTIRLDDETYGAIEKAVENGEFDSISAALRELIRWRTRSYKLRALKEDLDKVRVEIEKQIPQFLSILGSEEKEEIKRNGFFHGIFLLIADLVREMVMRELSKEK